MAMVEQIGAASDRVMAALIAGLERGASESLAQRFWTPRKRIFAGMHGRKNAGWGYESADDEEFWLDRVAICGRLNRQWFAATMIVDGEGRAHGARLSSVRRSKGGARSDNYCALTA